jgi:Ni/Co efflux regulator RcnB
MESRKRNFPMKTLTLAAISLMLVSGAAVAQPRNDHRDDHRPGPQPHVMAPVHGPAMAARPVRGPGPRPGFNGPRPGAHHLPPGFTAPRSHDRAPMWRGRAWAIGDRFVFTGFRGPTIFNVGEYGLPPARPGTHWIYTDGWFLMVGNRTGKIFDEIPADY